MLDSQYVRIVSNKHLNLKIRLVSLNINKHVLHVIVLPQPMKHIIENKGSIFKNLLTTYLRACDMNAIGDAQILNANRLSINTYIFAFSHIIYVKLRLLN